MNWSAFAGFWTLVGLMVMAGAKMMKRDGQDGHENSFRTGLILFLVAGSICGLTWGVS